MESHWLENAWIWAPREVMGKILLLSKSQELCNTTFACSHIIYRYASNPFQKYSPGHDIKTKKLFPQMTYLCSQNIILCIQIRILRPQISIL